MYSETNIKDQNFTNLT